MARLANYYAAQELGFKVVAFVVDEEYRTEGHFMTVPVLTWPEFLHSYPASDVCVHVAIGYKSMRARALKYGLVKTQGYELINIISSASYVAKDVLLGDNNFVMPGVVLETGVTLDSNNVVWSNTTICHDSTIGSHNFIAANTTLGGNVKVGDKNFLGFSTVVLQNLEIENEVLVGANSLVTCHVSNLARWQGSPAKIIGQISPDVGVVVG